jgi:thioredoxin reductase (NADPH)
MMEVVPGEVIADIGQLSGRPDSSVLDASAVADVEAIVVRTGAEQQHAIAHLFVFTGADPVAAWLAGSGIPIDDKGFIRTGADVRSTERLPLPLETGVERIFAVGDVRCGSVKRVGAAIGEGAAVVAQLHTFLASRHPVTRREAKHSP